MTPAEIIVTILILADAILFIWLANLSGRVTGLAGRTGPTIIQEVKEGLGLQKKSRFLPAKGYESEFPKDDDGRDA